MAINKPTNPATSLKRSRDGSGKATREQPDPNGHEFSHLKPSDTGRYGIAKPFIPVADRLGSALPTSKPRYVDPIRSGDDSIGARPLFLGDKNFVPANGTNNGSLTPGNLGQRPAQKSAADPSGFTPVLKSSAFVGSRGAFTDNSLFSEANDVQLPPRSYKAKAVPRKETAKASGRKPNAYTPTPMYPDDIYTLQGKGRILSPKPAPTSSYPPTGYPPPKFALPSNSAAPTNFLKQYTASATPSPLRSQSRPPYDPREVPNPTWAPYSGPKPSSSPYQPLGDYNFDPSRSSAPPQTSYQPASLVYGPYSVPPSGPIRSTPGVSGNQLQSNNSTPTPYSGQNAYYTPSGYVQAAPLPVYPRPYPPPNPTWGPMTPNAPVLSNNSTPGKPFDPKSPQLFTRPPPVTPAGQQSQEPIKYYVGDGVYKTAPSTLERLPVLPPSQGTVFEEDSYSKDLNRLARNGNWGSGGSGNGGPV